MKAAILLFSMFTVQNMALADAKWTRVDTVRIDFDGDEGLAWVKAFRNEESLNRESDTNFRPVKGLWVFHEVEARFRGDNEKYLDYSGGFEVSRRNLKVEESETELSFSWEGEGAKGIYNALRGSAESTDPQTGDKTRETTNKTFSIVCESLPYKCTIKAFKAEK